MGRSSRASEELVEAVAYYRKSSDEQEESIERQQGEVRRWSEKMGYKIIKEYIDSGKSGSKDIKKRTDFHAMLADSENPAFPKVILCWDSSRFGRLDTITGAKFKEPLRRQGIKLVTAKEGEIDWNTFEGRVIDAIRSESNHEYAISISKNTISGRLSKVKQGEWVNGRVPYGFDRVFRGNGQEILVPRTENFVKARNWSRTLVPGPKESKIVQNIFDWYVHHDLSTHTIARRLNNQGVPSPQGKLWTKAVIRQILNNKAYVGISHIGGASVPEFNRRYEAHNRIPPTEVRGNFEALVSDDLFARAQKKHQNIADKIPGSRTHSDKTALLAGVLFCGHCGYRLESKWRKLKGRPVLTYACKTPENRDPAACKHYMVYEEDILPVAIKELVESVDRKIIQQLEAKGEDPSSEDVQRLRDQLDSLRSQISKGERNLLLSSDELRSGLESVLLDWKKEATKLQEKIERLTAAPGELDDFALLWGAFRRKVITFPTKWRVRGTRHAMNIKSDQILEIEEIIGSRSGEFWSSHSSDGEITFHKEEPINEAEYYRCYLDGQGEPWIYLDGFKEEKVAEAVHIYPEVLRGFLKQIGFRVTLFWSDERKGKWKHPLERGKIKAEIDSELLTSSGIIPSLVGNSHILSLAQIEAATRHK